jgi:hypothetical protein
LARLTTLVPSGRRVWVLLAFDPETGLATRPVGAAGFEGERWHVSWVPLEPAADGWRERLRPESGRVTVPERLTWWAEHSNGVTVGLALVDPPPDAADLAGAVEAVVDGLLCHAGGW